MTDDEKIAHAREILRHFLAKADALQNSGYTLPGYLDDTPIVTVAEPDVDLDADLACQTNRGPCSDRVEWMIRWHRPCGHPPVLGYCEDHALGILSRNWRRLASCRFCLPDVTPVEPVAWWRA